MKMELVLKLSHFGNLTRILDVSNGNVLLDANRVPCHLTIALIAKMDGLGLLTVPVLVLTTTAKYAVFLIVRDAWKDSYKIDLDIVLEMFQIAEYLTRRPPSAMSVSLDISFRITLVWPVQQVVSIVAPRAIVLRVRMVSS